MDRVDLAQQRLALMKSIDEESVLTQLSTAWVMMRAVSSPPSLLSSQSHSSDIGLSGRAKGPHRRIKHLRRSLREIWRFDHTHRGLSCLEDAPGALGGSRDSSSTSTHKGLLSHRPSPLLTRRLLLPPLTRTPRIQTAWRT
jgi:hypothetical protein